jgi:hypothetical protein
MRGSREAEPNVDQALPQVAAVAAMTRRIVNC